MGILIKHDSSQIYYTNSYWKFTSIHIVVIKPAKSHDPIITQSIQFRYDFQTKFDNPNF